MDKGPTSPPADEFVNRKLIRPSVHRDGSAAAAAPAPVKDLAPRRERPHSGLTRRAHAPEQTHAETFYFQKQVAAQTRMSVVLKNGEIIEGVIEWYDRTCLKLRRNPRQSVLVYKAAIRYLHKAEE